MQRIAGVAVTSLVVLFACSTPPRDDPRAGRNVRAVAASFTSRFGVAASSARNLDDRTDVVLPTRASDAITIADHAAGVEARFRLRGARSVAGVASGGDVLYPGAVDGADLLHRRQPDGVEDFVAFEARPSHEELVYDLDVRKAAGVRLVGNTLELLDRTGSPVLRVAPPWYADAKHARHAAHLALEGCEYTANNGAPFTGKVVAPGANECVVHVSWHAETYPILVDPAWQSTGKLAQARRYHTSVKLSATRVLVVGGEVDGDDAQNKTAEVYDAAANSGVGAFITTGSTNVIRFSRPSLTLLASGKVLLAGGNDSGDLDTAEIYDPAGNAGAGTFTTLTNKLTVPRDGHSATLLGSGLVLIAGGNVDSAELFDPGMSTFTATTGMLTATRFRHGATLLESGKVLLVGGLAQLSGGAAQDTAEIYDPSAGTFTATGTMSRAEESPIAFTLPGGKALIAGRRGWHRFDPSGAAGAGAFDANAIYAGLERIDYAAAMLTTGKVVVAGGWNGFLDQPIDTTELIDGTGAGTSVIGPKMTARRRDPTVAALSDGQAVVIAGGDETLDGFPKSLDTAERLGSVKGEACKVGGECFSGFCSGGVCCDTACNGGPCERCNVAGKEGTCTNEKGYAGACPAPFTCDGVSPACPTKTCSASDPCTGGLFCENGQCGGKKPVGAACVSEGECAPGFCVDGVCCNAKCTDACSSCSALLKESGKDGECGPTKRGTDPKNLCDSSATACANDGFCDGLGECRTVTPTDVSCGSSVCQGNVANGQFCNGSGECKPKTVDCAPFKCGAAGCTTSCAASADCAETAYCNAGKCTALEASGRPCTANEQCSSHACDSVAKVCTAGASCDGDHTVTATNGTKQDCSPFKCESTGACATKCTKVDDCASPAVCDAAGACVIPGSASNDDDGGCYAGGRSTGEASSFAALGVLALAVRRRRRRR